MAADDEVSQKWLRRLCRAIGQEFYLGRVEYTTRTEKTVHDGKEFVRHVHEQVPMAIKVLVEGVSISSYNQFRASLACRPVGGCPESRMHYRYQVDWGDLHEHQEYAFSAAENKIREAANKLVVKGRD